MCKIHISVSERRFYWSPGAHTFIYELPAINAFPLQQQRNCNRDGMACKTRDTYSWSFTEKLASLFYTLKYFEPSGMYSH